MLALDRHHRIGPLLAERLAGIPDDPEHRGLRPVRDLLEPEAVACEMRNRLLRAQLADVVRLLAENGVQVCLMKGAVSLADAVPDGYLSPRVRPMEDLDVMVVPESGEKARDLLRQAGVLCESGTEQVPFSLEAPARVDLHVWSRAAGSGFLEPEAFADDALAGSVAGIPVGILRPHDAFQLRLVHNVIRQHAFINFPLLEMVEMANIARRHRDEIRWDRIRSVGLMHGVARIFYAIWLALEREFAVPVPQNAIPDVERRWAEVVRLQIERLDDVPDFLYYAACRDLLIRSMPGSSMDKVGRAGELGLTLRGLAGQIVFAGWRLLRA